MCTAIHFFNQQNETIFGRTMDFHHRLDLHLTAFPEGSSWEGMHGETFASPYAAAGICHLSQAHRLLLDGVNEAGLAGGALYFKGYADFPPFSPKSSKQQIPALDFLRYVLGHCASLEELPGLLADIALVEMRDKLTGDAAPLHWSFADQSGRGMVIEQTCLGLRMYENPVGVLTNSPDFPWQMTNLRNYMEVTPEQAEQANWNGFQMEAFGQASRTSALPGGYTPPARFVRTVFQKLHMIQPAGMQESIVAGFHILEGVTLPKGVVKVSNGAFDTTQYTSMIDLENQVYYFKTYENPQIIQVNLKPAWNLSGRIMRDLGSIHVPIFYEAL